MSKQHIGKRFFSINALFVVVNLLTMATAWFLVWTQRNEFRQYHDRSSELTCLFEVAPLLHDVTSAYKDAVIGLMLGEDAAAVEKKTAVKVKALTSLRPLVEQMADGPEKKEATRLVTDLDADVKKGLGLVRNGDSYATAEFCTGTIQRKLDGIHAAVSNHVSLTRSRIEQNTINSGIRQNRLLGGAAAGSGALLLAACLLTILSIASITRTLQKMTTHLAESAAALTIAAAETNAASQELAEVSSRQSSQAEEITASLKEVEAATLRTAEQSAQANRLMEETGSVVTAGSHTMSRVSAAINEVQQSAKTSAEIIRTIDEIAFQTNLLALNAAVEAARAGDAGRSFAVVAEEVRSLARRSADAARRTSDILDASRRSATEGVSSVAEMSQKLQTLQDCSVRAAELVAAVTSSSQVQAQGIARVGCALKEIEQLIHDNAANAEEYTTKAHVLSGLATDIHQASDTLTSMVGTSGAATTATNSNSVVG